MAIAGSTGPETNERVLRFGCTMCGACCNRAPEVELSEAAELADMFVFRLMFRLYQQPRTFGGCAEPRTAGEFYEAKRLLGAFAARKQNVKRREHGRAVDANTYLTISALAVDSGTGACPALGGGNCTIHARRPLACRTVPFHYSRPEAAAAGDLEGFVGSSGFRCDTSAGAPAVVAGGRIVEPGVRQARADALVLAGRDRRWKDAILGRMRAGSDGLPGLREIEANAAFGATTVSMHFGWRIAAEAGLLGADAFRALIAAQMTAIERALAAPGGSADMRETLVGMRAEYRGLPEAAR